MVIGGLTVVAGLALAVVWSSAEGDEVVIEPFTFSCDSAVGRRTKVVLGWRYRLPRERERCLAAVGSKAGVCRQMTESGAARILARRECVAGFHQQVGRCVAHFEAEREKCGGAPRVVNVAALGDAKRRAIQAALVSNGFSLGRIDGKFGPKTRKSVREWQSKAGHAVTGELTSEQIRELLEGREARSVSTPSSATAQTSGDLTTKSIRYHNAVYHGQTRYGKPHGRGVKTWTDGERYEGDFVDGELTRGVYTWADGNRYEGEWRNYEPHGRGVFTWADGGRYEGDFIDGNRTGRGVYTWANGNRYEGDFVSGKRTGRGVFTSAEGRRYEGDYRDGKWHGRGVSTSSNGSSYEGNWRDGSKHGRGIVTMPDGTRWEGDFVDGRRGNGTWTEPGGKAWGAVAVETDPAGGPRYKVCDERGFYISVNSAGPAEAGTQARTQCNARSRDCDVKRYFDECGAYAQGYMDYEDGGRYCVFGVGVGDSKNAASQRALETCRSDALQPLASGLGLAHLEHTDQVYGCKVRAAGCNSVEVVRERHEAARHAEVERREHTQRQRQREQAVQQADSTAASWGAFAEAGNPDTGQTYGVGWDYPTADGAVARALKECSKRAPYDDCAGSLYVFSDSLKGKFDFYETSDVGSFEEVRMVPARCILVTETPYSSGGGDVVRMFYDTKEEAQRDFADGPGSNLYMGTKFLALHCNGDEN